MLTLHAPQRTRKSRQRRKASPTQVVPAEHVKGLLREIAFVLHATRVVRRMDESASTKKD